MWHSNENYSYIISLPVFCEIAFRIKFVLYIQIIKIIYDHLRSSAVAQITHYFEFIIITQYYISKMSGL